MKKILLSILCLAALVSCTKEIEFNGEQTDPKLVINSIVEPGQSVKAYISKSYFFLDNVENTAAPDDLVATLFVNGERVGEMTRQTDTIWQGYEYVDLDSVKPVFGTVPVFASDYRPIKGDIVTITATANGFDDVEATTSPLPNEVVWSIGGYQTVFWEEETEEYEEGIVLTIMGQLELTVEVTDPNPGKTDFFRIQLEGGGFSDYEYGNSFYISTTYDDPVFGGSVSGNDYFDIGDLQSRPEGVFTDALFDGRSYQIKLPLYLYYTIMGEVPSDFFQVSVRLEHLSREYYYYLNTCEQGDEIMQFFAEPVQTYSNVSGGYGIVAGLSIDSLSFPLPLEEP